MPDYSDIRRQLVGRSERLHRRMRRIHEEMGYGVAPLDGDGAAGRALGDIVDAGAHERWLIEAALVRIDREEYGRCRDCAGQIGMQRLELLPYARRCEKCAPGIDREALSQLRLHHLALDQLLAAVRASMEELAGGASAASASTARVLFADLALELPEHFELEERGGYLSDVVAAAPALAKRAAELVGDHIELRRRSRKLFPAARSAFDASGWARVRIEFEELADRLATHEAKENALVREAFRPDVRP